MPPREWLLRIEDILTAIARIEGYVSGITFEQFVGNDLVIDAVVRNLILIGEAANHVPPAIVQAHHEIPWRQMTDMRHFVTHVYWRTDSTIVWDTVQRDLPKIIEPLRRLLRDGLSL